MKEPFYKGGILGGRRGELVLRGLGISRLAYGGYFGTFFEGGVWKMR